jgi:alpha-tubulin suppressor-like RCC1 family protein
MKLQTAKCTTCGASLKLQVDKTISECSYCKSQIIVSNALDFNKVEVDKSKDIIKYRDNLKKYIRNNSIEEILRVSNQILDILPKDFLATYFAAYAHQVKGEPNYIYEFYLNILEHTPNELEEVVEHINKRSDLRDDNRIIKFLNKTDESYADKYKQIHLTRLELEDNYADIPRDIFLSYKSKDDNQLIEKIVSRLEDEGYSVWVSYRNLRPNDNENYWSSIEKAIKNSNIFLVVSEAASMRSKDVQKEINIAVNYSKKLIEFKIDQTPHTQLFKYVFDGIKWVEGIDLIEGLDLLVTRLFNGKMTNNFYNTIEISKTEEKPILTEKNEAMKSDKIVQIIGGYDKSLALSSFGRVFSWGNNLYKTEYGEEINSLPKEITKSFKLNKDDAIKTIFSSYEHFAAISKEGKVFMWGDNSFGALGIDEDKLFKVEPVEITKSFNLTNDDKIIEISLGMCHSASLSTNGRVFVWGRNKVYEKINNAEFGGMLGDNSIIDRFAPVEITSNFKLNDNERIVNISLGGYHSAALSSQGRVFTWGSNEWGQLGIKHRRSFFSNKPNNYFFEKTPVDISNLIETKSNEKIINIHLGDDHSSALSNLGRVFMWGNNANKQITNLDRLLYFEKPIIVNDIFNLTTNDNIKFLNLGDRISSAISLSGRVYEWGNLNSPSFEIDSKERSEILSRFNLSVGDTINYIYSGYGAQFAISKFGRVFSWGENDYGQMGDGTSEGNSYPTEITKNFLL